MGKTRSAFVSAIVLAGMCASATASAQSLTPSTGERYGFGTFKHQGRTFAGLVMRFPVEPQQIGGVVVELAPAARAAGQTGVPTDVMSIIEQWEKVGPQLKKIVAHVGPLIDRSRPAYVHDYKAVDVLAPMVPRLALYGFGNYRPDPNRPNAPANPSASPTPSGPRSPAPSIPGLWERDPSDDRPVNPRIFQIPNTPEVFIGDGEPVMIWRADRGRNQYEYECELAAVVGKKMRRVPVDQVKDYIMGYTITNDISDRQGRGADEWPSASNDPLLRKGKDSSKPFGPFIVPAEFVNPLNLRLKMTVGGVLVQDASTKTAWHNVYEYGTYLSNLITVPVGTVIAMGTPPGSHGGLGRFMVDGDVQICSYEGLGTLTNPVKNEGTPPAATSR
jgi:2-keto-4-pentenoate hydratase/2-oxohepta-3-ene-1,7-dioic acid hydratase in catechol pathway